MNPTCRGAPLGLCHVTGTIAFSLALKEVAK
jgi:hypothetical protein